MIRWGILSTGGIARKFAGAVAHSATGRVVAVASRTQDRAEAFAKECQLPRGYGSYDALLHDPEVDVVYIATPHPMHAEWAIKAAQAKKHILCEKPLTMNYAEAREVIDAARRNDVFLMEAFMYRCHPQTAAVVEAIRTNAIGDVRVIHATFSFYRPCDLKHRALNPDLGGGGILDVGCYCVSMVRLVAGAAQGIPFADPEDVVGVAHIGTQSQVDEYALACLRFPGGILAQVAAGVQVRQENAVRIYGSEGNILIPVPWGVGLDGSPSKFLVTRNDPERTQEIVVTPSAGLFTIEADTVAAHIADRQAPPPAMTWDDTLGNMKTLDRWREAIGLRYPME